MNFDSDLNIKINLYDAIKKEKNSRNIPLVCIQGLGFVGIAMAVVVANSLDDEGNPFFNAIGVDLSNSHGTKIVSLINSGKFPFRCNDKQLTNALSDAIKRGNLFATTDSNIFKYADVVIVDINLDLKYNNGIPYVDFSNFRNAIKTLGEKLKPNSLILVETTVPPGTCEKIVVPEVQNALKKRNMPLNSIYISHSYERVMPGENYLNSIKNYWRVYSGITEEAANKCKEFLSKVINVKKYPLTKLNSTKSSETAKILENSYRAVNIAFIEEWGRFAENIGIDLFEVIDSIKKRPTHSNIRRPGFGVGGYCLTKDPLFGVVSVRDLFNKKNLKFVFSETAIKINRAMPLVTLNKLKIILKNGLKNKKILLMGVSYRQDIGDTRYSPSEIFAKETILNGALLKYCDPLVKYWKEMKSTVICDLNKINIGDFDAIVFAVQHKEFKKINFKKFLKNERPVIFDANNVLTKNQIIDIKSLKCKIVSIGRGDDTNE